jgi:GntR family transcriptional regulator
VCENKSYSLHGGIEVVISINFRDSRPIYEQIKEGMRRLIVSGALPAGSKISSVREMASGLAINPSTIQRAYRELEAEGYICSVPGKGSFVCTNEEAEALRRADLLGKFDELVTELGYAGISKQMLSERLKGEQQND